MREKNIHSILNNIEYSNKLNRNEYSILNTKRNKKNYSDKAAQQKALYLSNKFHNPGGLKFYLKVAWNLTDDYIDWLVDYSQRKTDPSKYFVFVANKRILENK